MAIHRKRKVLTLVSRAITVGHFCVLRAQSFSIYIRISIYFPLLFPPSTVYIYSSSQQVSLNRPKTAASRFLFFVLYREREREKLLIQARDRLYIQKKRSP